MVQNSDFCDKLNEDVTKEPLSPYSYFRLFDDVRVVIQFVKLVGPVGGFIGNKYKTFLIQKSSNKLVI